MRRSRCAWIWRARGTALSRSRGMFTGGLAPPFWADGGHSQAPIGMVRAPPIAGGYNPTTFRSGRLKMAKEMKEFAGLFYREGALDPKTMSLVALAAMAAAGCTS